MTCLVCNHDLDPIISFGRMPIANGFLMPDNFDKEFFFELRAAFCPSCTMVQLGELVDETKLFHGAYPFFSSTSKRMSAHFATFADWVRTTYLTGPDPLVVEIGSNDGIMLQNFQAQRIRHLGVEPSENVAGIARSKGLKVVSRFFDATLAREVVAQKGQADAVLGANVMCHIPYLHSVAEGVALLLKPTGILAFEDPYVGDIVEKTSYDQIYDEHVFYFSATSVSRAFAQHGLELIDVLPQDVHGGSLRYVLARKGAYPVSAATNALLAREILMGLHKADTYQTLRKNVEQSRDELTKTLQAAKSSGKRVVGYAATSKSTTVINYCGISPDLVEFISDTTPLKQGKYSPGAHIPVRSHDEFKARYPDHALLFGWNHAREIKHNERDFIASGGRWIEYVPKVRIGE